MDRLALTWKLPCAHVCIELEFTVCRLALTWSLHLDRLALTWNFSCKQVGTDLKFTLGTGWH